MNILYPGQDFLAENQNSGVCSIHSPIISFWWLNSVLQQKISYLFLCFVGYIKSQIRKRSKESIQTWNYWSWWLKRHKNHDLEPKYTIKVSHDDNVLITWMSSLADRLLIWSHYSIMIFIWLRCKSMFKIKSLFFTKMSPLHVQSTTYESFESNFA